MHILMLCEYFYPFDRGGSEWSTYYLAQSLVNKGHTVSIFTPNYGDKPTETWKGIQIHRFWFPIRLKKGRGQVASPLWHSNLLWILVTVINLLRLLGKNTIDVIHIQGKYFLPSMYLVKKITKKPVVCTVRDFQLLCPYGLCLSKKRRYKVASLAEFVGWEMWEYQQIYGSGKNPLLRILLVIAGLRGFLVSRMLIFFARRVDCVITISNSMKRILSVNGIESQVIYNPMFFFRPKIKKTD